MMKKTVCLLGSVCWFVFAASFGALVVRYVAEGAGLQFSAWLFSDFSLFIGMVHILGLIFASLVCLVISAGFWVRTFVVADPERKHGESK